MASIRYTDGPSYDQNNSELFFDVSNSFLYDGSTSSYSAGYINNDPTFYGVRNNHTGSYNYSSDGKQYSYYDDFSDNTGVVELVGSNYGDLLYAGSNADTLSGGAGNDTLEGGAGADTLSGGEGSDTLSYEHSIAAVNVNLDQSVFTGGDATGDSVMGIENLRGSQGNDNLVGDNADNVIEGGLGADTLEGGGGNDTLSYEHSAAPVNVALGQARRTDGDAFGDTATGFENLKGSQGNDNLTGDAGDNVIEGGAGGDALDGGDGTDTLSYASSALGVTVNLSTGTSTGGDAQGDTFSAFENLRGSESADSLTGNADANVLYGGGGNDTLDGGTGNDTMIGEDGNDRFYVGSAGDVVREDSGDGSDTVYASVSYTLPGNVENLILEGTGPLTGTGNTLANALTANDRGDTLRGGAGNDTLKGGAGNDALDGGTGNDDLTGGLGDDRYYVDSSGDAIHESGGGGTDTLYTSVGYVLADGASIEYLRASGNTGLLLAGNDLSNSVVGGTGNDFLQGGSGGTDKLFGGKGDDTYLVERSSGVAIYENAGEGTDTVLSSVSYTLGSNVEDLTLTGTGAISGTGNALANVIIGNGAVNILQGGDGNDVLVGSGGADRLYGNAGADTFLFAAVSDSALNARDGIYDFVEGTDRIDLSRIDANQTTGATGDQAFTLVATYTGAAGQLRTFSNTTQTYVEGDVNGDRKADFQIVLSGVHTLHESDFVL